MSNANEWPKAFRWFDDASDLLVFGSRTDIDTCKAGFTWNYAMASAKPDKWILCKPPAIKAELTTLRTFRDEVEAAMQLSDAGATRDAIKAAVEKVRVCK